MGVGLLFGVKYPSLVDAVDAYFPVGVKNKMVLQENAHMNNFTLLVVEKSEITGFAFIDKAQGSALLRLLRSIAI